MIALDAVDTMISPPLAPLEPAIDREHLSRMTLGDRSLEREVLALFERQADLLLARVRADAAATSAVAHTLKGSARGIGAWPVAQAAEALENATPAARPQRLAALEAAVTETQAAIADLLAARA
jgi:HPt (histidine-containing phosphotransfer) domain-containing protein